MAQFNTIRPVTQRLNSTPVEDLPRYAGYLATSILNSSELLRTSEGSKNDAYIQVHKLTTRVSSLLQDRTQEGRFTAIVLVKALIEASGSQILATSGSAWVRGLLLCLNKQDPAQVKLLSIVTITRIFLLTKGNQSMLREITTPSLPPFITACLSLIKPRVISSAGMEKQVPSILLQPVLQCWAQLIRAFPSTFRPFVPSIRAITLSLLSQHIISHDVKQIAVEVFSTLHFCAPKDTTGVEWAQSVKQIIEAAHQTADLVLRSILEEWSSASGRQNLTRIGKKANLEPRLADVDAIGMTAWTGMQSGCSRLVCHLQLLETMVASPHAQVMKTPIAEVLDLTARLAAVLLPTNTYALRENKEITRDEREELYTNLPRVHRAVLSIYEQISETFGHTLIPISHQMLSHVWDILATEAADISTRVSLYNTTRTLLQKSGSLFIASDSEHISLLIRICCQDLRRADGKTTQLEGGSKDSKVGTLNIELQQPAKQTTHLIQAKSAVEEAAGSLLPVILTCVPHSVFPASARSELDRHTILLGHEKGLLASVMNPPVPRKGGRAAPSVLPFLARNSSSSLEIEALLRPRMPIVHGSHQLNTEESEEDGDGDEERDKTDPTDGILHAVEDHVFQQLVEDESMSTALDHLPAKKRGRVTAEDSPTPPPDEPSKKARVDAAPVQEDLLPDSPSAAQLQSEVKEAGESIDLSSTEPSRLPEAMELSTFEERSVVAVDEVDAIKLEVNTYPQQEDDDSDGSEIPQIDTALSTDDEEDDEEDEADI